MNPLYVHYSAGETLYDQVLGSVSVRKAAMEIVEQGCKAQHRFSDIVFHGFTNEARDRLWELLFHMDRNVDTAIGRVQE